MSQESIPLIDLADDGGIRVICWAPSSIGPVLKYPVPLEGLDLGLPGDHEVRLAYREIVVFEGPRGRRLGELQVFRPEKMPVELAQLRAQELVIETGLAALGAVVA